MIKDKDRTPVAKDVITMCTKCGMELNHVVISQNLEGLVERVKCHTCGSEHKYRRAKAKPVKKTVNTAKKTKLSKNKYIKKYEELLEKHREQARLTYSMEGTFKENDVVDHRTFGLGIVTSVSAQKMEVAFPERPRVLACNRPAT